MLSVSVTRRVRVGRCGLGTGPEWGKKNKINAPSPFKVGQPSGVSAMRTTIFLLFPSTLFASNISVICRKNGLPRSPVSTSNILDVSTPVTIYRPSRGDTYKPALKINRDELKSFGYSSGSAKLVDGNNVKITIIIDNRIIDT